MVNHKIKVENRVRNNPRFFESLISESIVTEGDAEKLRLKFSDDAYEVLLHLVKGGARDKEILGKLWGDTFNLSYVNLEKTLFESTAVKKLPEEFARKHNLIPIYVFDNVATTAMAEPFNDSITKQAEQLMGCQISPVFSFPAEIEDAIEIQYQTHDSLNEFVSKIASNSLFKGTGKITHDQLQQLAGDQASVELARSLMLLAVKEKSSDIHIDPQEDMIYVRFRVDGVLQDRVKLDKSLLPPLITRLKVLADLDITERRRPMDGRVKLEMRNKSIDFRMSSMPTIYGEKIVLRALGQIIAHQIPDISELDLSNANYKVVKDVIDTPNGIFFVTGPTGSGKTTTLFSVLKYLNIPGVNVMTVEDPVEYRLPRVNQVQVNSAIGFDFSKALRSFLRQDPDVILIGEIRDLETAKIASQAALTGHLVLASIHTNSALQAVTRLIEIGVEPFLVAPSIIGVMAQRLVRRICPHCKEKYQPTKEEIESYFIWDGKTQVDFYRGRGCIECFNTGYSGRIAIHEVFIISETVRTLVSSGASIIDINKAALDEGFKTMRYDGFKKVLLGLTTAEEVERVTAAD